MFINKVRQVQEKNSCSQEIKANILKDEKETTKNKQCNDLAKEILRSLQAEGSGLDVTKNHCGKPAVTQSASCSNTNLSAKLPQKVFFRPLISLSLTFKPWHKVNLLQRKKQEGFAACEHQAVSHVSTHILSTVFWDLGAPLANWDLNGSHSFVLTS